MFNDALKYYLMLYNDCKYKIILIYKAICVCYKNYGAQLYQSKKYNESIEIHKEFMDFIVLHALDYIEYDKENELEWKEINDKYKYIAMKHTAQCYNIQNNMELTNEWMMKILEMEPFDWIACYYVGHYALKVEKDLDKALEYLMNGEDEKQQKNMMNVSNKDRANAQYLMANIYAKKDDLKSANVCMEIALRLCDDMAYLYTAQAMMKAVERNYYELYSNLKVANSFRPWEMNTKEIEAHFKAIGDIIYGYEFEYSEQNKIALKCLVMIEYMRESNVECVNYATQYRNIDANDKDVNEIFYELVEEVSV
eukprot:204447_1